ncbi:MAG: hypothetical protein AAF389_17745 [Gemmatimonadota bacterium]
MMRTLRFLGIAAAVAALSTPVHIEAQEADPADVSSIGALITAVYDVISGDAGEPRDWDRWRTLFAPGATLSPTGPGPDNSWQRAIFTSEEYVERAGPALMQGFVEAEIGRKVERFGNIAHAFSAYESFRSRADTEPFDRGINSFQLLFDGDRWWVVSIFWQAESADYPIPAEYIGELEERGES